MARLLIVHHSPSPATVELFDAVVNGAHHPEITGVEVVRRAALAATASDLLAADAVVLGTPANIGYMSGALKHFFDTVFHVCADDTRGCPTASTSTATWTSPARSGPWSRSPVEWGGAAPPPSWRCAARPTPPHGTPARSWGRCSPPRS